MVAVQQPHQLVLLINSVERVFLHPDTRFRPISTSSASERLQPASIWFELAFATPEIAFILSFSRTKSRPCVHLALKARHLAADRQSFGAVHAVSGVNVHSHVHPCTARHKQCSTLNQSKTGGLFLLRGAVAHVCGSPHTLQNWHCVEREEVVNRNERCSIFNHYIPYSQSTLRLVLTDTGRRQRYVVSKQANSNQASKQANQPRARRMANMHTKQTCNRTSSSLHDHSISVCFP